MPKRCAALFVGQHDGNIYSPGLGWQTIKLSNAFRIMFDAWHRASERGAVPSRQMLVIGHCSRTMRLYCQSCLYCLLESCCSSGAQKTFKEIGHHPSTHCHSLCNPFPLTRYRQTLIDRLSSATNVNDQNTVHTRAWLYRAPGRLCEDSPAPFLPW